MPSFLVNLRLGFTGIPLIVSARTLVLLGEV
jgi:hypothetical protein